MVYFLLHVFANTKRRTNIYLIWKTIRERKLWYFLDLISFIFLLKQIRKNIKLINKKRIYEVKIKTIIGGDMGKVTTMILTCTLANLVFAIVSHQMSLIQLTEHALKLDIGMF